MEICARLFRRIPHRPHLSTDWPFQGRGPLRTWRRGL